MSVDVTSIVIQAKSDGIDAAAKSLNNLADAAEKVEKSSVKVASSSKETSDTASKASSAIDKLLIKYQAQVDLLGTSVAQQNAYNAALKGGTDAQQSAAAFLGAEVDAYKALTQAQSEGIAMNKALDASYSSLSKQADAYYASQAKIAAAAQALNDAGYRAQEYAKLKDAMKALEDETNALAAAEAREKAIQQNRDIEMHTAQVRAYSAAQSEAIRINNELAAAEQRQAKASAEAFNAIGPTRANLDAATKSGEQFVANLKAQTDVLGLSAKQLREYQVAAMQAKAAQLGVSESAAPMIEKFKDSAIHASHASSGVSGIARELLVLGHEASQGQYTRLGGSFIVLLERADAAGKAVQFLTERAANMGTTFGALVGTFAAIAAAIGVVVAGLITWKHSLEAVHEFNKELILTGNSAGGTADSFYAMADGIGRSYGAIGDARKAMMDLISTGKFTAAQIRDITDSAVGLSTYGGQSVDVTAKQFEKLAKDPLGNTERSFHNVSKAALELNQTLNFLDPLTMKQILDYEALGDNANASATAIKTLNAIEQQRVAELKENMTWLGEKSHELSAGFTNMWNSLWVKQPVLDRIKELQDQMSRIPANEQGGYHFKELQGELADAVTDQAIKQQQANNKAEKSAKDTAAVIAQSWLTSIAEKTKGDTLYQQMLAKNLQQEAALREVNANDSFLSEKSMQERRAYLLKEYGEKAKKARAEGTSGIDAELKQIEAASEWEKRDLDSQVGVLDNSYKHKTLTLEDYSTRKTALLEQEKKVTQDTYSAEVEALLAWSNQSNRTVAERNTASGKIQELSKKAIDQLAKEDEAIQITGNLFTQFQQKEIDDAQTASEKVVDSIKKKTAEIQAQVDAYNNLPQAVRDAGLSEKRMADEISQAKINALDELIAKEGTVDELGTMYNERRVDQLKSEKKALEALRDTQSVRETQQTTNKFNLGFAARAKEEAAMAEAYFKDAGKTISSDLQAIFGDASKPMQEFFTAFTDGLEKQTKAQENYNKVKEAYKDAPEALKQQKLKEADIKLTEDQTKANLGMFGDTAAAAAGFFDKQSKGYAVMNAVSKAAYAAETAMAIASIAPKVAAGVASMFAQSGWGGFAGAAALLALMAGLGYSSSGSTTAPATSAERQAANGTGSVLGDSTAKSESIQNALDIIAKDSGLGLVHFNSMDKSLQTLVANISGLSSLLVQGTTLTTTSTASSYNTGMAGTVVKSVMMAFGDVLGASGFIDKITGGLTTKITTAIFGGKTSVEDVGLTMNSSSLGNLLQNGASVSQYVDTKTTGGWFSSDKYKTTTTSLGDEINSQFSKIITNLADTVKSAASILGLNGSDFEAKLNSFVVDIGEISTKGLTGEEIQTALETAFSKLGDDMAKFAISGLDQFQQVGEGYLETVARVANDLIQVQDVFASLGQTLNATGIDAVKVSEGLISAFGDIDTLTSQTSTFIDAFYTDAEKLAPVQKSLSDALVSMGLSASMSVEEYKKLVLAQDLNTTSGQTTYAALLNLASAFQTVSEASTKAEEAATELLSKRLDMELTIANLENDSAAASAIVAQQRQIEIDALDESLRPLQERINALNDEQDAITALNSKASTSFDVLSKAITKAKAEAQSAYDAQAEILNAQIDSLTSKSTALGALNSALESALNTIRGFTEDTAEMTRAQAEASLDSILAKAKTTGVLPTSDDVSGILSALTKDPANNYSSYADYIKDVGITAGKIEQLNGITETQKTVADKQLLVAQNQLAEAKDALDKELDKYDDILSYAQQQLDAMNGTTVAVQDLTTALMSFNASVMSAIGAANTAGNTGSNGSVISSVSATSSDIYSLYESILGRTPDAAGYEFWLQQANSGATASQIAQAFLSSDEYVNGSHAGGLDSVPFDGYTAKLHKGEMVLPASQAKGVVQSSDMDAVVESVEKSREETLSMMEPLQKDINYLKKLFQNSSPDGTSLQVKIVT